jgi:two-component system response regulator YesN
MEAHMYSAMLIFSSAELLKEIRDMDIWGEDSGFEIDDILCDGKDAYNKLLTKKYDLVICETEIKGMESTELLKRAKREKLCANIALCSEKASFEYARQGIIFGAFDYFTYPFEEKQFRDAFMRIKNKANDDKNTEAYYSSEIISMIQRRDKTLYDYIPDMLDKIYSDARDRGEAENVLSMIYKSVIDEVFKRNEWLDLYKSSQSFYINNGEYGSYKDCFKRKLFELFEEYCALFPEVNNAKIQEVILHILNNPESDLKQKTIAAGHYINSSYLSTVFSAQTQLRFVDYLTTVKLKRAGWLLQNSAMKVTEVAARLDYKDIGYFSRMFKKQYGVTPTEYRIPDDYTYQI